MSSIINKTFNIHNAKQFVESINEPASDNYYLCFGKHLQYANSDSVVEDPEDSVDYKMSVYKNIIFGKKIEYSDVTLAVARNVWETNTAYDMYRNDTDISAQTFFVAALSGTDYNVYKCLDNANGAVSTEMPTTVDTAVFTESDGYTWKYMYTIAAANWTKFATASFMPVYTNTEVMEAATNTSIEVILTDYSGSYYNNYITGIIESVSLVVTSSSFKLSGGASDQNDFYKNCIVEFTTNDGIEYREVSSYSVSGTDKIITMDQALEGTMEPENTYRIYPKVYIYGDGHETNTCLAWAIVDSTASNSISRVEVITTGSGYRAATANVMFDSSVGVTDEATLTPIISPVNGHGYDPAAELFATTVTLNTKIFGDESENIVGENDFRTISLLKNPLFRNIKLEYTGSSKIFDVGETVYAYRPIQLYGSISTTPSSSDYILLGNNTSFEHSFEANDYVLVDNGNTCYISTVNTITSNTELNIRSPISANVMSSNIFLAKVISSGVVTNVGSNSVTLTQVSNNFAVDIDVIGANSFSCIMVTDTKNNDRVTNDLITFQQTIRFDGSLTSVEEFDEDEEVYQLGTYADENLRPTGRVFYFANGATDYLYITNENNTFSSNATIIGRVSNATFISTNKYDGDLIKDSGEIIYINNIEAVSKSNTSIENVKTVIQF